MAHFIARRLAISVALILAIVVVVFVALRLVGGDPAKIQGGVFANDATLQKLRQEFGTDDSHLDQFRRFVTGLLQADLGSSFRFEEPVMGLIGQTGPKTLLLGGTSLVIVILLSAFLGVAAAARSGGWLDRAVVSLTVVGQSLPVFFIALVLVLVFAVRLGWLPAQGYVGPESLVLPVATVVLVELPWQLRVVRSAMIEVLHEDHMQTARAYGLRRRRVLFGYALRNAALPWLSVVGIQAGWLLGGSIVAEVVFNYPGLGALFVQSVAAGDYPLVQGITLVTATIFVLFNLLVDIAYTVVDPRVRL